MVFGVFGVASGVVASVLPHSEVFPIVGSEQVTRFTLPNRAMTGHFSDMDDGSRPERESVR